MRVVFLSGQLPQQTAPPLLSADQINCGPGFLDQQSGERTTPNGEFDIGTLIAELPAGQYPDVVVCQVDCGFRIKPRNFGALRCPTILLVADSHWGDRALSSMVAYAASEPFSRVVVLYDRHHLEFYRAAGIKNIHWFPALTFPHPDARVDAALGKVREPRLVLVGKVGWFHPRRRRLFDALVKAKLPLVWHQVPQADVIAHYGSSSIGINVSMNGDVNLRVFEVLAGGAMLLTDRLSADAGLDYLLVEGREKVSYASECELIDHARYFLSHPEEARVIGEAGQRWFRKHFNEQRRRAAFADLVVNGRDLPEFALVPTGKVWVDFGASHALESMLACYDVLNELHRQQEKVTVLADHTVPEAFASIVTTLPRARLVRVAPAGQPQPDLLVCGRDNLPKPLSQGAPRFWCWDWPHAMVPTLQGWAPIRPGVALFEVQPAAHLPMQPNQETALSETATSEKTLVVPPPKEAIISPFSPVCYVVNCAALGDTICAAPVVKWAIEHLHKGKGADYHVLCPKSFWEVFWWVPEDKKNVLDGPPFTIDSPPWLFRYFNPPPREKAAHKELLSAPVTSMRMHLSTYGSIRLTDRIIPLNELTYLPLPRVPVDRFVLEGEYVIINSSYRSTVRRMPADTIAEIAAWVHSRNMLPVIVGKTDDRTPGQPLFDGMAGEKIPGFAVDLRNDTTILELVTLMAGAWAVVTMDTGAAHLAATTEVPLIIGWTSLSPDVLFPLRKFGVFTEQVTPECACRYCQSLTNHHFHLYDSCWRQLDPPECCSQMTGKKFINKLEAVLNYASMHPRRAHSAPAWVSPGVTCSVKTPPL